MSNPGNRPTIRRGWSQETRSWRAAPGAGYLRSLLMGAALLWALWSCGREVVQVFAPSAAVPDLAVRPARWDLRSPPAERLAMFLGAVDRQLPSGRLVTVATRPLPGSQDFFLYLWAAYLLPGHDVVRARHRWTLQRADYLLTYETSLAALEKQQPGLVEALPRPAERLLTSPVGDLYRLGHPEPTSPEAAPR